VPERAKSCCRKPGCRNLVDKPGFCFEHVKEKHMQYDRYRESSSKRGYDSKWRKYREYYLAKHPLCVKCGRIATDVDHIKAVNGQSDPLFWVESNHQSLCHECHSRKTALENGGLGNG
jgi:5-methylcytosine-specific restriction protein A